MIAFVRMLPWITTGIWGVSRGDSVPETVVEV